MPNTRSAESILERLLKLSQAESMSVWVGAGESLDLRFAVNTVTTCGASRGMTAQVSSNFGSKSGTVSTNDLSDEGLEAAVRASEELARLSPENPEFMPPLGREQQFSDVHSFDEETAAFTPAAATDLVARCLKVSRERKIELAGFFSYGSQSSAVGTSNGLRATYRTTHAGYSTTARTYEGRGSNKVQLASFRVGDLDLEKLSRQAIERAFSAREPRELPPGRYPALLEPSAFSDMLGFMFSHMARRSADEGRSYFSEAGGKTKLGQSLFPANITVYSDPKHDRVPVTPFGPEYLPRLRTTWIEDGRLRNLITERFWAKQCGAEPVTFPGNIIMQGSERSYDELLRSIERGVLVTNFWYIRDVDPQKMLLTGLTRDGIFWVENGKVQYPIKNFRFNESPPEVLRNIIDMSVAVPAVGNEVEHLKMCVPAVKVSSFNFSTLSDAI